MNDGKTDTSFKRLLCLLLLVGVALMGAGIWITFGFGFSLMFVGFSLLVARSYGDFWDGHGKGRSKT